MPAAADSPGLIAVTSAAAVRERTWALALLTSIAAFNTIDRQVVTILTAPMKHEFHLTDGQVGLIGLLYGVLFALAAPPLALLAQRTSRRAVIAGCMAVFSAATTLCGLSFNFLMVLVSRLGVGLGEAGTSSPSQSLVADSYPPEERTFALSIFSAASKPGGFIAFLAGGWLAQMYGWRATFIILGLPGILIAVLAWLFVKEPATSREGSPSKADVKLSPWQTLAYLRHTPSFWHILIGQALWSLFALGAVFWIPLYLQRTYALKLGTIGTVLAFYTLLAGTLGVILIGWLCQKMQPRDLRWILRVLMIATAIAVPLTWAFFTTKSLIVAALCAIVPASMTTASLGPCSATTQAVVPPPMRTLTVALSQCFLGLLGMGVGPWLPGVLSDAFQSHLGPHSSELSLRYSLLCFSLVWIWAAMHFHFANRSLVGDVLRADQYPTHRYP